MTKLSVRSVLLSLSNNGFANYTVDEVIAYIDTSPGARPAEPPAPSPSLDPQWCVTERRLCRFSQYSDTRGWRCGAPSFDEKLCE